MPAQAGIQTEYVVDSGLRRSDGNLVLYCHCGVGQNSHLNSNNSGNNGWIIL